MQDTAMTIISVRFSLTNAADRLYHSGYNKEMKPSFAWIQCGKAVCGIGAD